MTPEEKLALRTGPQPHDKDFNKKFSKRLPTAVKGQTSAKKHRDLRRKRGTAPVVARFHIQATPTRSKAIGGHLDAKEQAIREVMSK